MEDRSRQCGTSLAEALVVCALCAVLLGAALPGLGRLVDEAARERTAQRIHAALSLGRTLAVHRAVPVTVCPPDEDGRCSGDWDRPVAVFEDPDREARITEGVERWFEATADARIVLRAFRSRRYMRFLPSGQTDWQNGRFVVCPVRETLGPVSLVLNVQGRVRRAAPDPEDHERCPATG